mmetsp:Transcript_22626/g.50741  ORF Transcript_22626/g.50741 Transcript_22626/m.50741 type:complete len:408 (+) Transcript_22626:239-1462(+)
MRRSQPCAVPTPSPTPTPTYTSTPISTTPRAQPPAGAGVGAGTKAEAGAGAGAGGERGAAAARRGPAREGCFPHTRPAGCPGAGVQGAHHTGAALRPLSGVPLLQDIRRKAPALLGDRRAQMSRPSLRPHAGSDLPPATNHRAEVRQHGHAFLLCLQHQRSHCAVLAQELRVSQQGECGASAVRPPHLLAVRRRSRPQDTAGVREGLQGLRTGALGCGHLRPACAARAGGVRGGCVRQSCTRGGASKQRGQRPPHAHSDTGAQLTVAESRHCSAADSAQSVRLRVPEGRWLGLAVCTPRVRQQRGLRPALSPGLLCAEIGQEGCRAGVGSEGEQRHEELHPAGRHALRPGRRAAPAVHGVTAAAGGRGRHHTHMRGRSLQPQAPGRTWALRAAEGEEQAKGRRQQES